MAETDEALSLPPLIRDEMASHRTDILCYVSTEKIFRAGVNSRVLAMILVCLVRGCDGQMHRLTLLLQLGYNEVSIIKVRSCSSS
jgi:hypothetical protein